MSAIHTQVTVDWDAGTGAICNAVVNAVAEVKNVDPLEVETPLYDVVDPDALATLFEEPLGADPHRDLRVSFSFGGCAVTVDSDGTVTVRPEAPTVEVGHDTAPNVGVGSGTR